MDKDYEQTLELARRFDSFMKESKAIAGLIEQHPDTDPRYGDQSNWCRFLVGN